MTNKVTQSEIDLWIHALDAYLESKHNPARAHNYFAEELYWGVANAVEPKLFVYGFRETARIPSGLTVPGYWHTVDTEKATWTSLPHHASGEEGEEPIVLKIEHGCPTCGWIVPNEGQSCVACEDAKIESESQDSQASGK